MRIDLQARESVSDTNQRDEALPSILDADDVIDDLGRWRKHGAKMGSGARVDN